MGTLLLFDAGISWDHGVNNKKFGEACMWDDGRAFGGEGH